MLDALPISLAVLGASGKRRRSMVATLEDVTDRLKLSEDLRRAQEMEALGRLAGGIAHEINTPTQFIADNLSFLSNTWGAVAETLATCRRAVSEAVAGGPIGELASEVGELWRAADVDFVLEEVPLALAQSQEGVERVASIVRAMKAFGHPDRDDPEPTDLNRLVEDTLTMARNEVKYVADVTADLGAVPTALCYSGAVRISRVFVHPLRRNPYTLCRVFVHPEVA